MNKAILIGNLSKDPEISTTANGVSVCRFSIAVSRKFTNADGERDADFINIVTWRNLADICHKYLKKGSKCGVVGSIQSRSYDAQDGSKRYITEVVADEVEFLNSPRSNDDEKVENEKQEDNKPVGKLEPIEDDTLPF